MELAIDTTDEMAAIGLSLDGVAKAELRWSCPRRHNAELLPAIDGLLRRASVTKNELTAVFVCLGPGSYMGVRIGVATAKTLAHTLGLPLVGVNRLALDGWQHRGHAGPIVPVHRAGRSEWAWAAYRWQDEAWDELAAPTLGTAEAIGGTLPADALICGEPDDALLAALGSPRFVRGESAMRRPAGLGELGHARIQSHGPDDAATLVPLYLREPAIGPQGG